VSEYHAQIGSKIAIVQQRVITM